MNTSDNLYIIFDEKEKKFIFEYRTGAGNKKKALFNNPKYAKKAISDFCKFWNTERSEDEFKILSIDGIIID